ncbi:MAG: GDP-mannose 4,6-dehydratase [Proteobacteria bacterium]|nr:GDP-mannose 4,6-dehydratase [Pseudomonadota bacterium]
MGKRYYVTGGSGFVGSVLETLITSEAPGNVFIAPGAELDIRDANALEESIAHAAPDYVVHLAAQSFVPDAFKDPRGTLDVNFYGTLNVLSALRATRFAGRMLFVGSGDMYGLVDEDELPVVESRALKPRNPYAVSKVAAEALCYQWAQTENIDVVMARPFNHIGPGQDTRFAIADFAAQVARMKTQAAPPVLSAGDVDAARDFTDVRDIARAYLALLASGRRGETYNVCSGTSRTIRELIEMLGEIAALEVSIVKDPARYRPAEQKRVFGDTAKIRAHTGWAPTIDIRRTLEDTLDYWLEKAGNQHTA